jgi:hypothetical protein
MADKSLEIILADNVRESVNFDSVLRRGNKVQAFSARYASQIMFNPDTGSRITAITNLQTEIVNHFDKSVIPAATQLGREQAKRVIRQIGGGAAPVDLEDATIRRRILFEGDAKASDRLRIVQRLVNDQGNTLENRLGVYWLEPGREAKSKLEQLRRIHEDGESRRIQYEQRLAQFNAGEGRRPTAPRLDFLSKFTQTATQSVREQGRRVGTDAEHTEFQKQGFSVFTWVTVNAGDACPDCRKRQGTTGTMAYFDQIGRPGSGSTVCGSSCFCILVPKETIYHAPGLARGVDVPGKPSPDPVITPPEVQKQIDDQKIEPPAVAAKKDPKETVKQAIAADKPSLEVIKKLNQIEARSLAKYDRLQSEHAAAEAERESRYQDYLNVRYSDSATAGDPKAWKAPKAAYDAAKRKRDAIETKINDLSRQRREAAHKAIAVDPADRFPDGFKATPIDSPTSLIPTTFRDARTSKAVNVGNAFAEQIIKHPPEFKASLSGIHYALVELPEGGRPSMQVIGALDKPTTNIMRLAPDSGALGNYHPDKAHLETAATVLHELGHELEGRLPGAIKASKAFLTLRTEGQRARKLADVFPNSQYAADEIARDDEFSKAMGVHWGWYAGKDYGDAPYSEILPMGLQKLFLDPIGFAKNDPEYFRFVLGLVGGRIQM